MSAPGHRHTGSVTQNQNQRAQLANAYNELGKELSSQKLRVVGNYTLGKVIGEGAYGKVRMGTHRLTASRVAIKQIPKNMSAALTREIHHHRRLHHPHVMQLYEVIATESSIWLVTELCSGGELFDYLVEKGRLNEPEAKVIFGQLCLAIGHVHDRGVVHRDLKLENVLLDERCRVKLGDFGFTREYERGTLLDTFCGTTGYASPEMLQGKKYLGPEVDIWSLGIILYCLLVGTLPFDDDDEGRMREKIILGEFEDPEWLSPEARDLIRNILQQDPTKRLSIAQILAHPWFTAPSPHRPRPTSSLISLPTIPQAPSSPPPLEDTPSGSSVASHSTFHSATSSSMPTTPDESSNMHDPFQMIEQHPGDQAVGLHRNTSDSTLKKTSASNGKDRKGNAENSKSAKVQSKQPETVEEEDTTVTLPLPPTDTTEQPSIPYSGNNSFSSSKPPSTYPTRTPVRTKRRSVSSILSTPSTPLSDTPPSAQPPQDFTQLLSTPAPIIFSTPLERTLLNNLSALGYDTGQIVHSVLSDACDSSGAVWWMLKKKAEKKALEEGGVDFEVGQTMEGESSHDEKDKVGDVLGSTSSSSSRTRKADTIGSTPELAILPATPVVASNRPQTPPQVPARSMSPNRPLLSPSPSTLESSTRSHPSTPGGTSKDKEVGSGSKGRNGKPRSGSVSIMQRATTALEAAGIVRKKSNEGVRDERERDKEREKERDKDRERERERRERGPSGDDARSAHGSGSGSNKLTKSPPLKAVKDAGGGAPSIASVASLENNPDQLQTTVGSPWVVAHPHSPPSSPLATAKTAPPLTSSPPDTLTALPNIRKAPGSGRNRASLLSAFRTWFQEDRKNKQQRKGATQGGPSTSGNGHTYSRSLGSPTTATPSARSRGTMKRRGSGSGGQRRVSAGGRAAPSRRSSSVNSRRSSVASVQMVVLESPHAMHTHGLEQMAGITRQRSDASQRSIDSRTPNSEFPSRPSSAHSFARQYRHRKSPSTSSAGSAHRATGSASPLQKYHRRGGSGSSTRVVRQVIPPQGGPGGRPPHVRSNSATSSIHSLASSRPGSRPGSFYEPSEGEVAPHRTGSPFKTTYSRRSLEDAPRRQYSTTVLVAQKKQTPFISPATGSVGRSSWKKSWGIEPPGWKSRTTHAPIEVLAILPAADGLPVSIRDVFSGRHSITLAGGDDDDWVDEDDDSPFAGGLGQTPVSTSMAAPMSSLANKLANGGFASAYKQRHTETPPVVLSPPPRRGTKRTGGRTTSVSANGAAPGSGTGAPGGSIGRQKPGQSPVGGPAPLPPSEGNLFESSSGESSRRRQLPASRSGPAAIQEEDEDEEE